MAIQPPIEEDETQPPLGNWDQDRLADAAEKAKALRALFANQLYVQPDGQHLRLAIGERVSGEPIFHTALVVPNADALEFGELIVKMAQAGLDQQIAAMKQMLADETEDSRDGE